MRRLLLSLATLGERHLLLRELDGHTELLIDPDDPEVVRRLLGRVLREPSGAEADVDALLCVWRDRVFAALFEREVGGLVDSRARCSACQEDYAFGFDLAAVARQQDAAATAAGLVADDAGRFVLEHGTWLRPPTVGDVAAHPHPDSLARALAGPALSRERVEEILDEVAPLLSFDLQTRCVHCDQAQALRFDLVRYTLESLAAERPMLIREVHLIASRYGWGYDTVMGLTRADRRAYAALILGERNVTGLRSVG